MRSLLISVFLSLSTALSFAASETDVIKDKPRVHVITVIGTMLRQPADRLNFTRYALTGEDRLTASGLVNIVPESESVANITVESDGFLFSDTPEQLRDLATLINNRFASDPDIAGIVIPHGTNNIEETAYFLNLTVNSDKPVVITGSQRPSSVMSSDAQINLWNAIRVAADPQSRDKGILVATNGEIHSGRDVAKTHTYSPAAFKALDLGPLGFSDPDRIVYYRAPVRKHTHQSDLHISADAALPKVSIIYSYSGDDEAFVDAAIASGVKGIVVAGSGAGNMQNAVPALERASKEHGIVIARSARGGTGRVICDDNWQVENFVCTDNLNPQKARMLLQLALVKTRDPAMIQTYFDEY